MPWVPICGAAHSIKGGIYARSRITDLSILNYKPRSSCRAMFTYSRALQGGGGGAERNEIINFYIPVY